MDKTIVLGIQLKNRVVVASDVQKVLTDYGCNIKTRIGLHEANDGSCSPNGLILLQIHGGEKVADEMVQKLKKLDGVNIQKMVF